MKNPLEIQRAAENPQFVWAQFQSFLTVIPLHCLDHAAEVGTWASDNPSNNQKDVIGHCVFGSTPLLVTCYMVELKIQYYFVTLKITSNSNRGKIECKFKIFIHPGFVNSNIQCKCF